MTVQDQVRLWELEKNRLKSQEGRLKQRAVNFSFQKLNWYLWTRLFVYVFCRSGRLSDRSRVCKTTWSGAMGKCNEKMFLREHGRSCQYSRIYWEKNRWRLILDSTCNVLYRSRFSVSHQTGHHVSTLYVIARARNKIALNVALVMKSKGILYPVNSLELRS